MSTDPNRMCELLVGLDDVIVHRVDDHDDGRLVVEVSSRSLLPLCGDCRQRRRLKDRTTLSYVDLPCFGRPTRLVWRKRRSRGCCGSGSETEVDVRVAAPRQVMTTRAGRWATVQVGLCRRSVARVARELGCDWATVNTTVNAFGAALLAADADRVGDVDAVGLDETLFVRRGEYRAKSWATSIVDVDTGQLIDMIPARTATAVSGWFSTQSGEWVRGIRFGVLDLSGPYRKVFNETLGWVHQIADPFHVVRTANQRVDEVRRSVQNETLFHRGRKDDPLYGIRRLLTMAAQRLDDRAQSKLADRLAAGDPHGEVQWAWEAKEAVRDLYRITNHADAVEAVDELAALLVDEVFPPEVNNSDRPWHGGRTPVTNWHRRQVSNGPTEGANNLIKLAKRVGFGFRSFTNYRIRALLYAGKPNWALLDTILPAEIR